MKAAAPGTSGAGLALQDQHGFALGDVDVLLIGLDMGVDMPAARQPAMRKPRMNGTAGAIDGLRPLEALRMAGIGSGEARISPALRTRCTLAILPTQDYLFIVIVRLYSIVKQWSETLSTALEAVPGRFRSDFRGADRNVDDLAMRARREHS